MSTFDLSEIEPLGQDVDISIGTDASSREVVAIFTAGRERRYLPMSPAEAVWLSTSLSAAASALENDEALPPAVLGGPGDPRSIGNLLPDDIATLTRYIVEGVPTGSCFEAVLSNDLMDALGRADQDTVRRLPAIAAYVYNVAPRQCWGSRRIVTAWSALHLARKKVTRAEAAVAEGKGDADTYAAAVELLETATAELRLAHEERR